MKVIRKNLESDRFENLVTEIDTAGNIKAAVLTYELLAYDHENGSYQYKGPIKAVPVSSMDLTAKWACIYISIWRCNWGGEIHLAGPNCTPGNIYSETQSICFDDGSSSGGGSGGSGDPDHGGGSGSGGNTTGVFFDNEFPGVKMVMMDYLTMIPFTRNQLFNYSQNYAAARDIYEVLNSNGDGITQTSADQAQGMVDFLKSNNFSSPSKAYISKIRNAFTSGTLVSAFPLVKYPTAKAR